jgi:hypothetical protein
MFSKIPHLVRGQIIKYTKRGRKTTADILSDYYSPIRKNAHIYTLKVISSDFYPKGLVITESARVLYNTATIIEDVLDIKYKELVNDKKIRKAVANNFKKPPKEVRVRR